MVADKSDVEAPPSREIPHDHLFKVTGLTGTKEVISQESPVQEPADFETAIAATGFGRFNLLLLAVTFPSYWSAVSVTSSASFIFSRAQCDMDLSLLDMGTVNAMTYGGMISSALLWGFLSDTLGRRKIMAWGYFCSGLLEIAAAMSQNFAMLLVTKFACGFLFNGPFAVMVSYIAELHRTELRAKVILFTNLFYTFATTTLPLLAWAFLTHEWHFYFWGDRIVIHSWNLFLLSTALIPLISGVACWFLPESPKFLMTRGRNQEAMEVFRKIYQMNTGLPKEDFPIKVLVEEKMTSKSQGVAALRGGWEQVRPLFHLPLLTWLLVICGIHSGVMFGSNTLRLWYPQLAAMIGSDSSGSLCSAVTTPQATAFTFQDAVCVPIATDMVTYLHSAIVGSGSIITFLIGGMIINKCGKKLVVGVCGLTSALVMVLLPYLGNDPRAVVAMATTALAFTSLFSASLSSIAVDLFPTSLRVMAMATFLMCGRAGTVLGSLLFPALVALGCLPPFATIAAVLTAGSLGCFLLPNTTLKKLE